MPRLQRSVKDGMNMRSWNSFHFLYKEVEKNKIISNNAGLFLFHNRRNNVTIIVHNKLRPSLEHITCNHGVC